MPVFQRDGLAFHYLDEGVALCSRNRVRGGFSDVPVWGSQKVDYGRGRGPRKGPLRRSKRYSVLAWEEPGGFMLGF